MKSKLNFAQIFFLKPERGLTMTIHNDEKINYVYQILVSRHGDSLVVLPSFFSF